MENECKNIKGANCHEEHPAFSRSCAIYKKEKEMMFIKHTKNIPFPEVRKIVESYMGTKTYANVAQKVNQPPQDSTSLDKYKKLMEKLINLKANEWLTFQENLKRMHSTETKQSEPCIKTKVNTNTNIEENEEPKELELNNLIEQLPRPFVIMGDFNSHNEIWGSKKTEKKGKVIESLLNQHQLCMYNNKSNTYLHPATGTYSAIDLSICDPSLFLDYNWKVHDDTWGHLWWCNG